MKTFLMAERESCSRKIKVWKGSLLFDADPPPGQHFVVYKREGRHLETDESGNFVNCDVPGTTKSAWMSMTLRSHVGLATYIWR